MFNEGYASLYPEDVVFFHGDNKHGICNDNNDLIWHVSHCFSGLLAFYGHTAVSDNSS